ncbi:MAG TPA: 5-(carboxyamino)imidazole ribonucleotide synthase [Nevskiaceae bacterium]|nr:5-(carboxyamino)imidazole ribonucleotide synthase [Nevskiaceae bacterium]
MKIGILGAGQLGRMLALAGKPLGLDCVFLDPAEEACAASLGTHLRAAYEDPVALQALCAQSECITFEFENVPGTVLAQLAAQRPTYPPALALTTGQDRLLEKRLFDQLGIPVPRYLPVASREALGLAARSLGFPCVLKTRRLGYDGKGQALLRSEADLDGAWARLGQSALILESFVAFQRELSCLAVRGREGELRFYPVVENQHREGILRRSIPQADDPLQAEAEDYTRRVAEHFGYVGVLAFEFFVADGRLLANEIAPRVHNSGHWTIEGAVCSQFENHLRAVAGLPLGETALRGPCAMLNLIGSEPPAEALLAIPGLHLHRYGKAPKPGRKIGHLTLTAGEAAALAPRLAAAQALVAASG